MKYDRRSILSWIAIILIAILVAAVAGYGPAREAGDRASSGKR